MSWGENENAPTPNIMLSTSVYGFENEISQVCATTIRAHKGIPTKSIERYLSDLKQCGLIVYKGSSGSGGYYIVHDKE